jgi:uncharacterized protein (TIGR00730 family)
MGNDPQFASTARQVGAWIAAQGAQLVYGGGNNGLMGQVADATQAGGGRVVGIIPESMVQREWARTECDELIVVNNMHERKKLMAERADAFLALPGGIGTFEEFFETWTWRQLGYHNKPIGLLNMFGYYDELLAFTRKTVASQFMVEHQLSLIEVGADTEQLLVTLKHQILALGLGPRRGTNTGRDNSQLDQI